MKMILLPIQKEPKYEWEVTNTSILGLGLITGGLV